MCLRTHFTTTVAQEKQVLVTSIERRVIDAHAVQQTGIILS